MGEAEVYHQLFECSSVHGLMFILFSFPFFTPPHAFCPETPLVLQITWAFETAQTYSSQITKPTKSPFRILWFLLFWE